jgi:NADH:ubiquinone oxidoreductase subunit 5 (subunit L)/multisubunit Na+/H+ antiporter MnhA subunit
VPLLLLAPLLTFVLIVSGVRARRATSNTAALGLLVTLADIVLVGWARYRAPTPYVASYQWINVPVSFSGATQFQGFGIDISLRVDHLALAGAAVVLLASLGIVAWHRSASRGEAGPARFHAVLMLAVGAALGVLVSGDLAALAAWWGLCGVASYLLLAHRWGSEAAGRASQLGLWLPFAGDVALWCGVAVLYSRFGQLTLDKLVAPGVLHNTYGAGLKSIGFAAVLFGVAALVRGGVFPFTAWQTALEAPPAAAAWVQSIWPVTALVVLVRVLPIFDSAGPEPYRILAYLSALGLICAVVLSLLVNDLRRSVAWTGAALVALAVLGLGQPGALATSVAGMLAFCLARPVLAGASWSIAAAMHSGDLADMGGAWQRMRRTSLGYLIGALALALAFVPKAATRAAYGWGGSWFLGVALVLIGAALLRPYAAAAYGELRRRRAFEPTRVREVARGASASLLALAVAGAVATVLAFLTPWVAWFGGPGHAGGVEQMFVWAAMALVGCAVGFYGGGFQRDITIGWSRRTQALVAGYSGLAVIVFDRFLSQPVLGVVDAIDGIVIDAGGSALGRLLARGGGWVRSYLLQLGGGALGFAVLAIAIGAALVGLLAGSGR